MILRVLQILLAVANCVYGALLLWLYGSLALHLESWPPQAGEQVVLLVALSVLPAALVGLRFPIVGGILEFACAFIGRQLLHDAPLPDLLRYSRISMGVALAVLAIAVLRGITDVTREAFGDEDHRGRKHVDPAA